MVKSQWFRDKREADFAKTIAEADDGSHRISDVFETFLFAAYASLHQAVNKFSTGAIDNELEREYVTRVNRFKRPAKFAEGFAILCNALEQDPKDFLGETFGILEMNDKDFRGQCFTPYSLCEVLTAMTLGDAKPDPHHRLTLEEPCSGGGAIVVAIRNHLVKRGFFPHHWFLHATDIDSRCFHMTYIQATLLGVPAIVTRGNALVPDEHSKHVPTLLAAMFPLRPDRQPERRVGFGGIPINARSRTRKPVTT